MLSLPTILSEDKYMNTWEYDGWKPKAKPNAPKEVKDAIAKWLKDIEKAESGSDDDSIIML